MATTKTTNNAVTPELLDESVEMRIGVDIPKPQIKIALVNIIGTSELIVHRFSEKSRKEIADKQAKKLRRQNQKEILTRSTRTVFIELVKVVLAVGKNLNYGTDSLRVLRLLA